MLKIISRAKWLFCGNIIFAFSQWLILTLIARFTSNQALGEYSLALSIASPIFIFTNLQLRPILVADYNSDKIHDFASFFSLRFYTNILGIVITLIWGVFSNIDILLIIFLVAIVKFCEGTSDIIYGFYNAKNETRLITRSLTIKSLLSICLLLIFLQINQEAVLAVFSIIVSYIFVLIFLDLKKIQAKLSWLQFDWYAFKQIAIYALPLGLTVMLVSLQTNMPRYIIEKYDSIESVGTFTIFYYFIVIGGIFINSICQYLSPYYSIYWNEENRSNFLKFLIYSWLTAFLFGLISFILIYFFGDMVIGIIYGKKFNAYLPVLNLIMLSGIFVYLSVVNGYVMTSIKIIKVQVPMFIILLFLTFVSSMFLIPKYGLYGAGLVSLVTSFAQFSIGLFILLKKIRGYHVAA